MSRPEEVKEQVRISPFVEYGLVGAGGAAGAVARWGVGEVVTATPWGLPTATLLVNVIGCALIGIAAATIGRRGRSGPLWWFSATGVLGGFTTFSAFVVETDRMWLDDRFAGSMIYVAVTVVGGLGAVRLFSAAALRYSAGDHRRVNEESETS